MSRQKSKVSTTQILKVELEILKVELEIAKIVTKIIVSSTYLSNPLVRGLLELLRQYVVNISIFIRILDLRHSKA